MKEPTYLRVLRWLTISIFLLIVYRLTENYLSRKLSTGLAIPIIILTAKGDYRSRLKGFLQGAFDYITKPFNKENLIKKTKKLLSTKKK